MYTITTLGGPSDPTAASGLETDGFAINASGDVAGWIAGEINGPAVWYAGAAPNAPETLTPYAAGWAHAAPGWGALGINDLDISVGMLFNGLPYNMQYLAYLHQQGQPIDKAGRNFTYLPIAQAAVAQRINNLGLVVGTQLDPALGVSGARAFLYDLQGPGGLTLIDPLPDQTATWGIGINQAGHIVGLSGTEPTTDGNTTDRAFLYRAGELKDLGFIAFPAHYPWLNPSHQTPININDADQIISSIRLYGASDCVPAVYNYGTKNKWELVKLPFGFPYGCGNCINNQGVAVGACWTQGYEQDRYAYMSVNGVGVILNDLLPPNSAWHLGEANAINDRGQITGVGVLDGIATGFLLTPPPPKASVNIERTIVGALFGAQAHDGGGWIIINGVWHWVGPWPAPADTSRADTSPEGWTNLSPAERDALLGLTVNRLAASLNDVAASRAIREAALGAVRAQVDSMIAELGRDAGRDAGGGARQAAPVPDSTPRGLTQFRRSQQ